MKINPFNTVFHRIVLIILLSTFSLLKAQAQRFAYIDTEYILGKMEEYKQAQTQLNAFSDQWQKELQDKMTELDRLTRTLQADAVLLTDELRQTREQELRLKEKEINDLQKARFGFNGDLFKKKQELLKPIQDRVYEAVSKLAREKGYDFIFDKGGEFMMLYASDKFDKSDDVLKMLGINKAGTANKPTLAPPTNNQKK